MDKFHNDVIAILSFKLRYGKRYGDTGRTEVIQLQIPVEVHSWHALYGKPVLITEYGAGTVSGMHMVS